MSEHYQFGQVYPPATPISITSGPMWEPTWLALTVAPQKERATRDHLRAKGIPCFYPSVEKARSQFGKRIVTEVPFIGGYVYAQFRQQPDWDYLKRIHRLINGVVCWNGQPVAIKSDVIKHLRGITVEAEKLAAARAEMLRVREGDKARIISGALAGLMVDVLSIKGGEAFISGVFGGKAKAALASLERIVYELP